jgi:hypothetical protein
MTRYLTLAFLVSAAVASAEESAAPRPRCDRNGGTILVFHDYVGCGMNGDPNEIDPWHFNGVAAEPSGGAAIYSLDWRVGATADFNGDGVCDVAWSLGEDAGQDVTVDLSLSVDGEFQGPNGTGSQLMGPRRVVGAADYLGQLRLTERRRRRMGRRTSSSGTVSRDSSASGSATEAGGCWAHPMSWTDASSPGSPG